MTFRLTEQLTDEIINALENQEQVFFVDAESGRLTAAERHVADSQRYYALPEWTSADGFALREEFARALHTPLARDKLCRILHSGRGVFKGFKNVLKEFPLVEKRWHWYRYAAMCALIGQWYHSLCEIWGLEKLELDFEDCGDLLRDDFTFQKASALDFAEAERVFISDGADGLDRSFPQEVTEAARIIWLRHFSEYPKGRTGFVCRTLLGEFAGIISAAPLSEATDGILLLNGWYVREQYRGLGVGTELLTLLYAALKSFKKNSVLIVCLLLSDAAARLLEKQGFEKNGAGFLLHFR